MSEDLRLTGCSLKRMLNSGVSQPKLSVVQRQFSRSGVVCLTVQLQLLVVRDLEHCGDGSAV